MKKIIFIMRDFAKRMNQKNINAFAASTAFFLFLSLIPMLILLCTIIPYTPLTEANLMTVITDLTPEAMDPLIISIISEVYDKSVGILSTAAVATLWSAGKGVQALMRGLNAINGVEEHHSALVSRMIAVFYTIIMLLVLLLSLFIMVFGNVFVMMVLRHIPKMGNVFAFLVNFRYLIIWALLSLGLAVIYAYIPGVRTKLWMQLPGAALAAWAWNLVSFGFSIYVDYFNGFSTYSSLATIVMIMIWLYIGIYVIMIGAYVNKYFHPVYVYMADRKKENKKTAEKQVGKTGSR